MKITCTKNESCYTIALSGRLDTLTAPELENTVSELPNGIPELIFDVKDLEYISSAGLRVLLVARKKMSGTGSMRLVNVNETVSEILSITGFDSILTIE